jgi:hypothetical protein
MFTSHECKNDIHKLVQVRSEELAVVMDLCPRGEMDRCLCADNTKVTFPFDLQTFAFECRPKRVGH